MIDRLIDMPDPDEDAKLFARVNSTMRSVFVSQAVAKTSKAHRTAADRASSGYDIMSSIVSTHADAEGLRELLRSNVEKANTALALGRTSLQITNDVRRAMDEVHQRLFVRRVVTDGLSFRDCVADWAAHKFDRTPEVRSISVHAMEQSSIIFPDAEFRTNSGAAARMHWVGAVAAAAAVDGTSAALKSAVDAVYTAAANAAAALEARELRVHLFRLLRFKTRVLRDSRVRSVAAAAADALLHTAGLPTQGMTAAQYRAHRDDVEMLPGRAPSDEEVQAGLKELYSASGKAANKWSAKVGTPCCSAYENFVASLAALDAIAAVPFVAPADGAECVPWSRSTVAVAVKTRLRQLRNPDLLWALATWKEELSTEEKQEVTSPRLQVLSVADALEALGGEAQVTVAADASAVEPPLPWRRSTRYMAPGKPPMLPLLSLPCCLHPLCTPLVCQCCS
jgi:hypothetical protein